MARYLLKYSFKDSCLEMHTNESKSHDSCNIIENQKFLKIFHLQNIHFLLTSTKLHIFFSQIKIFATTH